MSLTTVIPPAGPTPEVPDDDPTAPRAVWEAPTRLDALAIAVRTARSAALVAAGRSMTRLLRSRGEARLRAAVAAAPGPVKVSFGAGTVDLPGWIDTDLSWRAAHCLDATRPWPLADGAVDYVYADQVIEHFPIEVGRAVLRHAFEALRPGGRIRLATPDVERTARIYLERGPTGRAHLARHRSRGYSAEHAVDLLRVTFSENGHRACYDLDALGTELRRAGFVDVRRHEVGDSDDPELTGLESRADPTEVATTLVVEARRPAV